jgi:hypothetical protein
LLRLLQKNHVRQARRQVPKERRAMSFTLSVSPFPTPLLPRIRSWIFGLRIHRHFSMRLRTRWPCAAFTWSKQKLRSKINKS